MNFDVISETSNTKGLPVPAWRNMSETGIIRLIEFVNYIFETFTK